MFSLASSFLGCSVGSLRWDLWWRKNFPHGLHLNFVFFKVPSEANLNVLVVLPSTWGVAAGSVCLYWGFPFSNFSLSEWEALFPILPLTWLADYYYFSLERGLKNPYKDYWPCNIFYCSLLSIFWTWVAFNCAGVRSLTEERCS